MRGFISLLSASEPRSFLVSHFPVKTCLFSFPTVSLVLAVLCHYRYPSTFWSSSVLLSSNFCFLPSVAPAFILLTISLIIFHSSNYLPCQPRDVFHTPSSLPVPPNYFHSGGKAQTPLDLSPTDKFSIRIHHM